MWRSFPTLEGCDETPATGKDKLERQVWINYGILTSWLWTSTANSGEVQNSTKKKKQKKAWVYIYNMKLAIGSINFFHCITAVPHEYMLWVDNSRSQASTLIIILALQVVMSAPCCCDLSPVEICGPKDMGSWNWCQRYFRWSFSPIYSFYYWFGSSLIIN